MFSTSEWILRMVKIKLVPRRTRPRAKDEDGSFFNNPREGYG